LSKGQVHNSIAAHKLERTIQKPTRFSNMIVAYALSVEVVENNVPTIYRETKLSSESEM